MKFLLQHRINQNWVPMGMYQTRKTAMEVFEAHTLAGAKDNFAVRVLMDPDDDDDGDGIVIASFIP